MKFKDVSFSLTENFLSKYKGKQPKWGPLGYFTYKRTYARELENGKSEEFWQTAQRVVEGCYIIQKQYCKGYHLPWNERKAQNSAQEMYRRIWSFKFLPPGRGLWAMGSNFIFEKGSAPLFNCGFVSTENIDVDFAEHFLWTKDMSMLGVGVGFDTLGASKEVYLKEPRITSDTHVCEDSREGWVNAWARVLNAFIGSDSLPKEWDYSQIRNAGEPILGFGGIAPGSEPLKKLITRTIKYLNRYLKEDKPMDSTSIVDMMNFSGASVIAGGIRRTSEIAFGSEDDEEFINLKSIENLDNENLARWASNNSIQADKYTDFNKFVDQIATNGEPGFVWLANCQNYGRMKDKKDRKDYRVKGLNPCGEITLESFELCNIAETFPSKHESLEDYLVTLKYAFLYCKTVTLLPTHSEKTNQVQMRNRRIGISQTGIIENVNKIGLQNHLDWCADGYERIKELDRQYSEWLCIPNSRKLTTVKPSGTVSLLPGVTPGIHFPHSKYYIRRIRVSKNSNLWKVMKDAGYKVEPDKNQPDYTMIVEFPVNESNFDRKKEDVTLWEQMELAAQMQAYWSDNSVSITVTFKPEEKNDLPKALSLYSSRMKSVSFLPLTDHKYEQAPYEEISEKSYEKRSAGLKKPKLSSALDEEDKIIERFCDGEICEV